MFHIYPHTLSHNILFGAVLFYSINYFLNNYYFNSFRILPPTKVTPFTLTKEIILLTPKAIAIND